MNTKNFLLRLFSISAFMAGAVLGVAQDESLGQFEGHGDIGSPAITGSASYDPAHKTYTLMAGGINIWGTNDQCHFLWKKMSGDFILRARLSIAAAGATQAQISWRPAVSGVVLQETLSLSPANWTNSASGATNPITVSTTNATKFYRLVQP